jgi:FkbH-like protein
MDGNLSIVVAANFVAHGIRESLIYWSSELGVSWDIDFSPPDLLIQYLLDPSRYVAEQNVFVIVLVQLERWIDCAAGIDLARQQRNFRDLVSAVGKLAHRPRAKAIIFLTCPPSPTFRDDKMLNDIEIYLQGCLSLIPGIDYVNCLGSDTVKSALRHTAYFDSYSNDFAQIPYTRLGFAALGTLVARRLYRYLKKPKKVIVVDCDNTLWRGICGERGPTDVVVGQSQRTLQQFLIEQEKGGRLLFLASKNNVNDVLDVFDRHSGMALQRSHLAGWLINWKSKSENIKSLAANLGLGLDSIVFIDDDAFECEAMRALCPEVLTCELPHDDDDIPAFIQSIWDLDLWDPSMDDLNRTQYYHDNAQRVRAQQDALTLDTFISTLELKIQIGRLRQEEIRRAAQLSERVNQFNLNGIVKTVLELQQLLEEKRCYIVSARDRFGDYGIVGMIVLSLEGDVMRVDSLLLSCRALGRGIERKIVNFLAKTADAEGAHKLQFAYIPTTRNRPLYELLLSIGVCNFQGEWLVTLQRNLMS